MRERASARVRERARERARGIGAQDVARRQPALSGAEGELHVLDALHCPQVLKANAFRPLADLGHLRFVERILDEASHRCSRHGHRRMRTGRGPVYSLHSRVRVARQGWVQASLHTTRGARHEPRAGRRAHCGREAREHGRPLACASLLMSPRGDTVAHCPGGHQNDASPTRRRPPAACRSSTMSIQIARRVGTP